MELALEKIKEYSFIKYLEQVFQKNKERQRAFILEELNNGKRTRPHFND